MKKCIFCALLVLLMFTICACNTINSVGVSTDYPAAIKVEGEVFLLSGEVLAFPELEAEGYTTGYTNTYPEEDDSCNFYREIGMPYAFYQGDLLVYFEENWRICTHESSLKRESATIVSLDDRLLVMGDTIGLCFASYGDLSLLESLSVGDRVQFFWNGMVKESYPGQIGDIEALSILEEGRDVLGLYREANFILLNTDGALGSGVTEIALDVSEVTSLTEGEKEALCYLISCDTGIFDCYLATYEGLLENGEITTSSDESSYQSFAGAVLYRFQEGEETEDGFQFHMEKWTSSGGALGYSDCEVSFDEEGAYSLTLPEMVWIS